jgi:UDP-3-O-[3-hydroxymyristoyl] glucosamine N-acyltransferase
MPEDFYNQIPEDKRKNQNFALTSEPYLFFVSLTEVFYPPIKTEPGVHPQAFIHPEATVDPSVQVGPFVCIEKGAVIEAGVHLYAGVYVGEKSQIGTKSILYSGVKVYHQCQIGPENILHSGCVIGSDGFGFVKNGNEQVKIPQVGRVLTGKSVEIGANTAVDRGTFEDTVLGDRVKIDNLCQIGHNCKVGNDTIICGHAGIAGNTVIGKNVLISGKVGTKGHLKIGDNVSVGGQSGVSKDIPENMVVKGYPAVPVKEYLKTHALYTKLPEIYKRLITLEKKLNQEK